MNAPIAKLYGFLLVLFALLVLFTSNWSVFTADELEARAENKRPLLEQQKVKRGEIRSADGELLAVSKPRGKGESKRFVRSYPSGSLFGHPIGYDYVDEGRTGIEKSENDILVGAENEFALELLLARLREREAQYVGRLVVGVVGGVPVERVGADRCHVAEVGAAAVTDAGLRRVGGAAHRPGRPPGRGAEPRQDLPEAPRRPARDRGGR